MKKQNTEEGSKKFLHNPPADGHIHPDTRLKANDTRPLFGKFAIVERDTQKIKEVIPFINTNGIKITKDDLWNETGNHGHFQYDEIELAALDTDGIPIKGVKVKVAYNLERVIIIEH